MIPRTFWSPFLGSMPSRTARSTLSTNLAVAVFLTSARAATTSRDVSLSMVLAMASKRGECGFFRKFCLNAITCGAGGRQASSHGLERRVYLVDEFAVFEVELRFVSLQIVMYPLR